MAVLGLGLCPMGTAPFGVGTPALAPIPGGVVMRGRDGTPLDSRQIDPSTRQYVFDAFGRMSGMTRGQQLVLLALTTVYGSSAIPKLGLLDSGGVIDGAFVQRRQNAITQALADLVKRKAIIVQSISVDITRTPVWTVIKFQDLTSGSDQKVAF